MEDATEAHVPVLLDEVIAALAPIDGRRIVDGTFGAGGYTRALLAAGARQVIALDRDPTAIADAADWAQSDDRLILIEARFGDMQTVLADADVVPDAIVLDIGVSSMQLDQAERGFSFLRDGPLDMRMSPSGQTAADLVNDADASDLADIFHAYGEERAARRIARAIVTARADEPIMRTAALARIVAGCLPKQRPGQIHPATRVFQALRIAVNDELGELVRALAAAEAILPDRGRLAVVTFHSLEDRIVKRYFQMAAATTTGGSRHAPASTVAPPRYRRPARPVTASDAETARNPRARSARLRWAERTDAPALSFDPGALGLPRSAGKPKAARPR